jgi:sugar phosphate isomerase/epimerase
LDFRFWIADCGVVTTAIRNPQSQIRNLKSKMTKQPFVAGAALPVSRLEEYIDWLVGAQRDLEIQDPFRPEVLDGDWRPLAKQARALLQHHTGRVGIHGPFDGLPLVTIDPKIREVVTARLLQGLDFAEEVGATHVVVHSPWLNLGQAFIPHSPYYARSDIIGRAQHTLAPAVKRAEQIGCTLVIENIFDQHPQPWIDLIASFDSSAVRASIDVGHAFIMHRAGGASPDAFVRAAGTLLEHLHLQDTDGLSDRHWPPGAGNINWFALFDALNALDHNPRLILELHDYDLIEDGAAFLYESGYTAEPEYEPA